jgi:hypothetical protein
MIGIGLSSDNRKLPNSFKASLFDYDNNFVDLPFRPALVVHTAPEPNEQNKNISLAIGKNAPPKRKPHAVVWRSPYPPILILEKIKNGSPF